MIRFLLRLVLVLVLIAALLIGMTCCAAKAVFGSCAEVGVQQTSAMWRTFSSGCATYGRLHGRN